MSMSTHAIGFKPPDAKWKKMKKAWDACNEAGVDPPKEVDDFFDGESPDDSGVEVSEDTLEKCGALSEFKGDMVDGWEIHIDKLPKDVKIVRVYNSY